MYELALFAGVAGGILGTKNFCGFKTVCYVEREPYCVKVIKARIRDGFLDDAPIWSDVRSFTKRNNQCRPFIRQLRKIRRRLVVTAGFPCQPFSLAGEMRADLDERNGWPDTIRIIREVRPQWVILENVPGLLAGSHGYFGQILRDLAESGYSARWDCVPASAIGANHQRDRLWLVAHADGGCFQRAQYQVCSRGYFAELGGEIVAYPNGSNGHGRGGALQMGGQRSKEEAKADSHPRRVEWGAEPELGRVAHGVAHRVDRLRAIGNGQVSGVVAEVWRMLR